ncbi:MAG: phage terminase small subunit [Methylomicrobium sp.]
MSRLLKIKAAQLARSEKTGINPYAAAQEAATVAIPVAKPGTLAHYQAAMQADIASLKGLKTVAEKIAAKEKMLEAYIPFVEDYLKQGHDYPNDVAVQAMIWLLDVGNVEMGLNLALTLIKHGHQQMPERFDRRDIETFLCDAMYDWANALLKKQQSVSPYLDTLAATMTADRWDVHPAVASKVYAMLAKHKVRESDYKAVVALCDLAEQINPDGAGVKTLRKAATSKLETP